ncbi:MAG TPA: S8 family serine peptidase, partial [Pyrinomonadaceae bacterium]
MKSIKRSPAVKWIILSLLLVSICSDLGVKSRRTQARSTSSRKISPELRKQLRQAQADTRVTAIIQSKVAWSSTTLDALLQSEGARITHQFKNLNARTVSLPVRAVEALAARSEVRYISPDRETQSFGHLSNTTGAEAIRIQTTTLLLGITTTTVLDGSGIAIAVLDSGIDTDHKSFQNALGLSRVIVNRDFTGEGRTDDPYGHGTHVASTIAGNGQISNGAYVGIAPNANVLNLRVLNSQGTGTVSSLLSALDWVITNRAIHNIRVVNMSLGTLAVDSYVDDPLCQAVRRLVDAGIVVVAAAGNNGKDGSGHKVYGQIHSPGNEPSAITVGASNTFGTDERQDDGITTYSSRGPTRSFSTDGAGVRHY